MISIQRGSTVVLCGFSLAAAGMLPLSAQNVTKAQISQNQTDEQDIRAHTATVVAYDNLLTDFERIKIKTLSIGVPLSPSLDV